MKLFHFFQQGRGGGFTTLSCLNGALSTAFLHRLSQGSVGRSEKQHARAGDKREAWEGIINSKILQKMIASDWGRGRAKFIYTRLFYTPLPHFYNAPYLPSKILHNFSAVPREIENNTFAKFWGEAIRSIMGTVELVYNLHVGTNLAGVVILFHVHCNPCTLEQKK